MMMADLLSEIEKFCAEFGVSESGFGRRFMGDPGFVSALKAGRECLPRTAQRARDAMQTRRYLGGSDAPEA